MVNGLELNANSSSALLKGAADYLGLSKGGSKKALWNRLNQKVQQLEYEELFLAANKLYKEEAKQKGVIQVNVPRQPGEEVNSPIFHIGIGVTFVLHQKLEMIINEYLITP